MASGQRRHEPRAAGRRIRGCEPTGAARGADWRASTRPCSRSERLDALAAAPARRADSPRSTPRPIRSTRCARASSASRSRSSPARPLTCRWRTTTPVRRSSCRSTRCWRRCSPGSRTRRAPKVGQQHQVRQRTCWPTTASRCAASRTTRCCRATCSRRTAAQTWKAWPSATSNRKGLTYEDVCGKGANQIAFAQVEIAARRRVLAAKTAR